MAWARWTPWTVCLTSLVCFSLSGLFVLESRGCACPRVQYVLESCVCCWGPQQTPCGNKHLVGPHHFQLKRQPRATLEGQLCWASLPSRAIQAFLPAEVLTVSSEVKRPRNGGTEGPLMVSGNANGGRCEHGGKTVVRKANPYIMCACARVGGTPRSSSKAQSKAQSKRVRRQESGKVLEYRVNEEGPCSKTPRGRGESFFV